MILVRNWNNARNYEDSPKLVAITSLSRPGKRGFSAKRASGIGVTREVEARGVAQASGMNGRASKVHTDDPWAGAMLSWDSGKGDILFR